LLVIRTTFETLWMPSLLLVAAAGFYAAPGLIPSAPHVVPSFLPIGLAFVGMFLGWRFQRSGAFFAIGVLLLYFALNHFGVRAPGKDAYGQVFYAGASILLPINLALLVFLEERGLFTRWGLRRGAFILAQAGALYWLTLAGSAQAQAEAQLLFHFRLFSPEVDRWTYLPQPALIFYALAFAALTVRLVVTSSPFFGGLLGALAATAAAFHFVADSLGADLFMTAAMAIVTVAVVQDSYRMAFIDELTKIPGRRALLEDMKRLGGRYVIAMADIDHFKKFNDTYGHHVGDQVLRMVAERLSRVSGGKTYRYGGEEFAILFPGKDVKTAWRNLEAVRQLVERSAFQIRAKDRPKKKPKDKTKKGDGSMVSVAVSIGVAELGSGGDKPEAVMQSADEALYRAKKAGRNQIAR
jgi:diguanylate cyclase (GGDEF)-like protein